MTNIKLHRIKLSRFAWEKINYIINGDARQAEVLKHVLLTSLKRI